MLIIKTSLLRSASKAFTLLESLVVLFLVSLLALGLTGGVRGTFQQAQERVFFMEFEHLYKESQQLASQSRQPVQLIIRSEQISNGNQQVAVPASVSVPESVSIRFEGRTGGNSSLKKIRFQSSQQVVTYQLYIGSGRYKKTVE